MSHENTISVEDLNATIDGLKIENDKLKKENSDLKQHIDIIINQFEASKSMFNDSTNEKFQLKTNVIQLQREVQKLLNELTNKDRNLCH